MLAAAFVLGSSAQDAPAPYTLHVYTNLFQIPTLVLSYSLKPLPPIAPERFRLRIDSGVPFAPRHVRLEGEDPISLTVLLDLSDMHSRLLPTLAQAFAGLAPDSLHAQDRVTVFAVDCALVRHNGIIPAESQRLGAAFKSIMNAPEVHRHNLRHSSCAGSIHLNDGTATVLSRMSDSPGRRVLLIITDGYDGGSQLSLDQVRAIATNYGVTVFAISGNEDPESMLSNPQFPNFCERSGGLLLHTSPNELPATLKKTVELLRGRYILEFQRRGDMTTGSHDIKVEISKLSAFIRPAGTSAPMAEPKQQNDLQHQTDDAPAPPAAESRP